MPDKLVMFRKKNFPDESPQTKAFEYADNHGGLPVFGVQETKTGGYSYAVTSWANFFAVYLLVSAADRCFYEIIRPSRPINMYIDAECYRSTNAQLAPGSEAERFIVSELERVVTHALVSLFGVNSADVSVFRADASDQEKLSCHFVFHVKGRVLEDYLTAGKVIEYIASTTPTDSVLWVFDRKDPSRKVLFADRGVYTLNRLFRMYQSTKKGSKRYLRVLPEESPGDSVNHTFFWRSLVTWFDQTAGDLKLLSVEGKYERGGTAKRPRGTAVSKRIDAPRSAPAGGDCAALAAKLTGMFVDNAYGIVADEDSSEVMIRVRTHVCEMGGVHSSNHIYYIINLSDATYYQGCPAERCKGKTGEVREVPPEFKAAIEEYMTKREMVHLKSVFQGFMEHRLQIRSGQ